MLFLTVSPTVRRGFLVSASVLAVFALARIGLWAAGESLPAGTVKRDPASSEPRALRSVTVPDRRLALTFDVTWGETVPARILDTLRHNKVKATFFVSGPWAAAHPDLLKRMVAEGHEIGNHGHQHISLSRYPREVILEEIRKAQKELEAAGVRPVFFRPPNGDGGEPVIEAARELGYTVVLWGTDSQDWATPGPDYIVRRTLARVHPGDIVHLNASDAAVDTPAALAALLPALAEKGFEPVTLSRLLAP